MKVSIVITCFNRERWIGRAIRSAISQRFPREDFEVIVVDDGSTDRSPKVIRDYGDSIYLIELDENRGLPVARNIGIRRSKGRFVVHLDSDDYMDPELIHIEYLHLALNPDWGAVACDYYVVDEQERHIRRGYADRDPIACGIMFRKEYLLDIGLYDEKMLLCEDEELRQRFERRYAVGFVHLPLYRYMRHDSNLTNNKEELESYRARLRWANDQAEK